MSTESTPQEKAEIIGNLRTCYICGIALGPLTNDKELKLLLGSRTKKGKQHVIVLHKRCYRNYVERA